MVHPQSLPNSQTLVPTGYQGLLRFLQTRCDYSKCRFPFLESNSFVFSPATYPCFDGGSHGNRESIDNLSESAVGRMFSIYARGVGGGQEAVEGRSIADEAGGGLQFFERLPLVPAVHEQRLGLLTTRAEVQSAGSTQLSTLRSKQALRSQETKSLYTKMIV